MRQSRMGLPDTPCVHKPYHKNHCQHAVAGVGCSAAWQHHAAPLQRNAGMRAHLGIHILQPHDVRVVQHLSEQELRQSPGGSLSMHEDG
jgi:hypothetical protein